VEKTTTIDWSYIGRSLALSRNGKVLVAGGVNKVNGAILLAEEVDGVWIERSFDLPVEYNKDHWYGKGVALSEDGTWMILGAPFANANGTNSGLAFLYQRNGNHWDLITRIDQPDASSTDIFGWSAALSNDGSVLAISARGAPTANSPNGGAVYVFTQDQGTVTFEQKLEGLDTARSDYFGCSIAIDALGQRLVIGSFRDDDYGGDTGSAYVFDRVNGQWTQSVKLLAEDGATGDRFGFDVSITASGRFIAIGAYRNDDVKKNSGSVYLFSEENGIWNQVRKFTHDQPTGSDYLGYSVGISDHGILVAGAYRNKAIAKNAGSVYVFS
jgi:hypothetical protein